ncbi:MAG: hypothetical protein Fur0025_23610 [Oscillatoriaceae cyanobacterium]
MTELNDRRIDEVFAQGVLIDQAIKQAIDKAVWEHQQVGNPVAAWRDGKVVWIPPEELKIKPEN